MRRSIQSLIGALFVREPFNSIVQQPATTSSATAPVSERWVDAFYLAECTNAAGDIPDRLGLNLDELPSDGPLAGCQDRRFLHAGMKNSLYVNGS